MNRPKQHRIYGKHATVTVVERKSGKIRVQTIMKHRNKQLRDIPTVPSYNGMIPRNDA